MDRCIHQSCSDILAILSGPRALQRMNNFTERRLASDYRTLLFRRDASDQEVFGFECMDGWSDLIEGSLRLIQRYVELASDVKITQVKEKFGLLRIYQRGGEEKVCLVLDICELVSGCVCELCGKSGKLTMFDGWIRAEPRIDAPVDFVLRESIQSSVTYSCWRFVPGCANAAGRLSPKNLGHIDL